MPALGTAQQFSLAQVVRSLARTNPGTTATVDVATGRTQNYGSFCKRVTKLGTALRRDLGVQAADRAAIISLNRSEYLEYFFGVPWSGAWIVPINIRLNPQRDCRLAQRLRL